MVNKRSTRLSLWAPPRGFLRLENQHASRVPAFECADSTFCRGVVSASFTSPASTFRSAAVAPSWLRPFGRHRPPKFAHLHQPERAQLGFGLPSPSCAPAHSACHRAIGCGAMAL